MIEFIDKTSEQSGTLLNRENMMALQGFVAQTTQFNYYEDGKIRSIVMTNSKGHTLTTEFPSDTVVKETFVGEKTIIKTTTFNSDGSITEVIS